MPQTYQQMYTGDAPTRPGMRHGTIVPYGPYQTADGLVNLAVQNEGQWERLCRTVLERPDLAADPRFRTNQLRVQNRGELEALIEDLLSRDNCDSVLRRLDEADGPYGA